MNTATNLLLFLSALHWFEQALPHADLCGRQDLQAWKATQR